MPPKTKLWELEEHSKGKHLVLRRYLNAWLPILSKYHGRLLIIDGFAGPGRYSNNHEGSPLIALDAAIAHRDKSVQEQEIVFVFIESVEERLAHLQELVKEKYPKLPSNIKVNYISGKFDDTVTQLLDQIDEQKKRLAPCFAMIDPFGVSDTPMSVIQRLMGNPKAEVYISVMYEFINRFLKSKEFRPHLDRLFGTKDWAHAIDIGDKHIKKKYLYDLYKEQLKIAGAQNAVHFDLFNGNRHVYGIFFATQSWLGADRIKEAIWKIAPDGDFIFRGDKEDSLDLANSDFEPLIGAIRTKFSPDGWVTPKQIAEFVGSDQTDYYSGQMKKNALKPLEQQGHLEVHPDCTRARKFTYRDDIRLKIK